MNAIGLPPVRTREEKALPLPDRSISVVAVPPASVKKSEPFIRLSKTRRTLKSRLIAITTMRKRERKQQQQLFLLVVVEK